MRKLDTLYASLFAVLLDLSVPPLVPEALAGRGSSLEAVRSAVESNSVDAIAAELERAERLLCPACIPVVEPLLDHQDAQVRRVATWWLARRGLASDLFIDAAHRLAQPDSVKARNAADVLGSLRNARAVEPLGAALNNPIFNGEARVAMASALGRIGELDAVPALTQALRAPEAPVRAAAAAALRELRGFVDPSPVLPLLADADMRTRAEAIDTIGAARGRAIEGAAGPAIARALADAVTRDASAEVRRKAAWALGEIGASEAIAGRALADAARKDKDASVRTLAAAAQGRLRK
jgi:HEAT repeat protein